MGAASIGLSVLASAQLFVASAPSAAVARDPVLLRSASGEVAAHLQLDPPPGERPTWTLDFRGARLFEGSAFGLVAADVGELLADSECVAVATEARDEVVAIPFGKASRTRDRHHELCATLRSAAGVAVTLRVRCYDDAFAFRYELGEATPGFPRLRLVEESTTFRPTAGWTVYPQVLEHHRTSHEHEVLRMDVAQLAPGSLVDLPLTFERMDGPCFAITEAALRRYAGLALRCGEPGRGLTAALSPGGDGVKVEGALPCVTPWRVVLLGQRPGALLESNVIHCLNDPPAFDAEWVRPGKLTWPWWNGYLFDAAPGAPILSLETSQRHVDFCADAGIAFHAYIADEADSPWYHQGKPGLFPGPETDATRVRDGLPLLEVRTYAESKGVGLWTWVHHGAVRGRTDDVFAALARHGFRGVMVDFLDRDDQETVEFCEEVLAAAARHHVLVHFHGVPKPTGLSRTYPNLMNHEGALNLEYLKWSARCTPEHTLRVLFTRHLAGPLDYHLGGFRAALRERFEARHVGPEVLGTRCHHLALYVCIDNPAPMVADRPGAYVGAPGFDFLRDVPTWWDETRVLRGEIGELLVTARRKGADWYLGGVRAGAARDLELPLGFLGAGEVECTLWRDADEADPNALVREERALSRDGVLAVRIGTDGGFVARLRPR